MADMTLQAFIAHMAVVAAATAAHEHAGMTAAAKIIEKEAKSEIGHYQSGAGPFVGWAELAERTKKERVDEGYSENDPGLRRGEMRDSIDHRVGDKEAAVGSDDDHLVWFEVGTASQPPRSVLGMAAVNKGHEAAQAAGMPLLKALVGKSVAGGSMPI